MDCEFRPLATRLHFPVAVNLQESHGNQEEQGNQREFPVAGNLLVLKVAYAVEEQHQKQNGCNDQLNAVHTDIATEQKLIGIKFHRTLRKGAVRPETVTVSDRPILPQDRAKRASPF